MSLIKKRDPDICIGGKDDIYMRRWWLIPKNKWFNIYLHNILRDDDDRALHDHPWANISIVLKGDLREVMPTRSRVLIKFIPYFRKATAAHRLELVNGDVWTLFITGRKVREWGFICKKGWVHWKIFSSPEDIYPPNYELKGRGCDE